MHLRRFWEVGCNFLWRVKHWKEREKDQEQTKIRQALREIAEYDLEAWGALQNAPNLLL